ncbi:MAG: type I-C CRISPR-associated protein Cas7/Csd2 [Planctomycetota bacterium]|jgi:CRISPR-associated protein Csd2|nr:type I-C CRISPR-associated protein Cas7/Csd2 [Planctomycetota bacterium]
MTPIINRYDFALLFDVENGNPNGDPDAGNLPRIDPETGSGLVTDVCLKRKVRNYVEMLNRENAAIYVREKAVLTRFHEEAYRAIGAEDELRDAEEAAKKSESGESEDGASAKKKAAKPKRKGGEHVEEARKWMCERFYDVRTFGAVMSLGVNCGQVRGPVQMTFAHSVDPVLTQEHSITRMAVATEAEAEKQGGDNRTMGRKNTIPYGLYLGYGFVSPHLAAQTGFSMEDLELFWEALVNMFEHDRSAARGLMSTRKLYIFRHDSALGNAPARTLFDCIKAEPVNANRPARKYADYLVSIDASALPSGVTLVEKP